MSCATIAGGATNTPNPIVHAPAAPRESAPVPWLHQWEATCVGAAEKWPKVKWGGCVGKRAVLMMHASHCTFSQTCLPGPTVHLTRLARGQLSGVACACTQEILLSNHAITKASWHSGQLAVARAAQLPLPLGRLGPTLTRSCVHAATPG